MDYGTLREDFMGLLNRTDCTEAQADRFIAMGLRRIERRLRTVAQQSTVELSLTDGKTPVPSDLLMLYEVRAKGQTLYNLSNNQMQGRGDYGYRITGSDIEVHTAMPQDTITIVYYAEFPEAASDAGITVYTTMFSDLAIYSSLVYASVFFQDERQAQFMQIYTNLLDELQSFNDEDMMSGGMAISPMDDEA